MFYTWKRSARFLSLALVILGSSDAARGAETRTLTVENMEGKTTQVIDGSGRVITIQRPDGGVEDGASRRQAGPEVESVATDQRCTMREPVVRTGVTGQSETLSECSAAAGNAERVVREYRAGSITVDDNGAGRGAPSVVGPSTGTPALNPPPSGGSAVFTNPVTIERMTTSVSFGYIQTHTPGGPVYSLGSADTYFLSDGSTWSSGAGSHYQYQISLDHVEVSGETIRYVLINPGLIYRQTDFNGGDHSAQGTLAAEGPLVLEATTGSSTAVLRGAARIVSNDGTYYGDRFNYYSAPVGSVVPFEITYTLYDTTWQPDTFDQSFPYTDRGWVDFAHPISVPQVQGLSISGSAQVPSQSTIQYRATARFEGDVVRDVTNSATWSVEPASLASISQGLLTTQQITSQETLVLHAAYVWNGVTVQADKTVLLRTSGSAELPYAWEMYQGDASHTGFVPVTLEPDVFSLRWQRTIGSGTLNPVTAADGRVFVSLVTYFQDIPTLFVLDARDGETLWSKGFGDVFSVNPPSYAYGNVYIQTGNHGSDTYLWAYDAATGDLVFQAPHAAQWERYFAPTIYDGTVYVNGGYYGGMYAFDAFSGDQRWFMGLPQYDDWTPAVDASTAYAYVGEYDPGVYAANRLTGASAFMIQDPNFDWNGWSMDLAPVLGTHNDLIAIHDSRLISFNLPSRSIRYELSRGFVGQPSVAFDTIYAIDGGALVALDEVTGNQLWSWSPPQGSLRGAMIVTNTHVFATTATTTYAVELLSHSHAWSFPVSGHLALGDETLYIASTNGLLTAISMPEYTPASLTSLEISGPAQVTENSSVQYSARAHYSDGRVRDRTAMTQWTVKPASYASFGDYGVMNVSEMFDPLQDVVVHASYTEGGASVEASMSTRLVIGVTLKQFFERNLAGAVLIKRQLLDLLDSALTRELAVQRAITPGSTSSPGLAKDVSHAIGEERLAASTVQRSIDDLLRALARLGQDAASQATSSRSE